MRALWDTSWAKHGRSMAGRAHIKEKHCIHCASCAEPSEARLRAADDSTLYLFVSSVSKEIEDASDMQSVLAFKNCQAVFRAHSLGALPVLAITGFVVKQMKNHRFLHH